MNLFPEYFSSAEDIIHCIKPWYEIATFFGIVPFKIKKNKDGQFKLFLSWTIIFTFLYYINFAYVYISYFPNVSENNIRRLLTLVDYTLYPPLALCFVTAELLQTKKFFVVLEELTIIDKKFQSINISFTFKKIQKYLVLNLFFALIILIGMYFAAYPKLFSSQGSHLPLHLAIYYFTLEVGRISFLLKSSAVIKIIKIRFHTINSQILSLPRINKMEHYKFSLSFSSNTQLFEKKIMQNEDLQNKIKKLRSLHERLSDTCELFNAIEEIPILLALGNSFVLIIINIFYSFNAWYNHGENTVASVIQTSIVVVYYFGTGMFLVPKLTTVSKEVVYEFYRKNFPLFNNFL